MRILLTLLLFMVTYTTQAEGISETRSRVAMCINFYETVLVISPNEYKDLINDKRTLFLYIFESAEGDYFGEEIRDTKLASLVLLKNIQSGVLPVELVNDMCNYNLEELYYYVKKEGTYFGE